MQVSSLSGAQVLEMAKQLRERASSRTEQPRTGQPGADQAGASGLSLAEFSTSRPDKPDPKGSRRPGEASAELSADVFARLDTDQNGTVTKAEVEAGLTRTATAAKAFSSDAMSALLSGQEAADGFSTEAGDSTEGVTASVKDGGAGAGIAGPLAPKPGKAAESIAASQFALATDIVRKVLESYPGPVPTPRSAGVLTNA